MTLQRPPPEILTLPRVLEVFSRMRMRLPGCVSPAVMAAKNPAAPPPTTIRSHGSGIIFFEFKFCPVDGCVELPNSAIDEEIQVGFLSFAIEGE